VQKLLRAIKGGGAEGADEGSVSGAPLLRPASSSAAVPWLTPAAAASSAWVMPRCLRHLDRTLAGLDRHPYRLGQRHILAAGDRGLELFPQDAGHLVLGRLVAGAGEQRGSGASAVAPE
jgi:hypothetical protein